MEHSQNPNIAVNLVTPSQWTHFVIFKNTQQFRLERDGHVSDFIEE